MSDVALAAREYLEASDRLRDAVQAALAGLGLAVESVAPGPVGTVDVRLRLATVAQAAAVAVGSVVTAAAGDAAIRSADPARSAAPVVRKGEELLLDLVAMDAPDLVVRGIGDGIVGLPGEVLEVDERLELLAETMVGDAVSALEAAGTVGSVELRDALTSARAGYIQAASEAGFTVERAEAVFARALRAYPVPGGR